MASGSASSGRGSVRSGRAVNLWYKEVKNTHKSRGRVSSFHTTTGHYTQVVWKSTKELGCGSFGKMIVCQYGPGGNTKGQFTENVPEIKKSARECNAPDLTDVEVPPE